MPVNFHVHVIFPVMLILSGSCSGEHEDFDLCRSAVDGNMLLVVHLTPCKSGDMRGSVSA